ncbi:MAG: hypothetical protein N2652_10175 [Kiritimatiellae bacterium]|nr:hypothetical protein [Kiritimatiellia bacterium]
MPTPTPALEYFTFSYPWRSSDYCLIVRRGSRALYGVADMIGHPQRLRWRNYMRVLNRYVAQCLDVPPDHTLATLESQLRDHLLWHDRQIFKFRTSHDQGAFGFCIAAALMDGLGGRLVWLGDCRAYRVRRGPRGADGRRTFEVACLTSDHNGLGDLIRTRGEVTLFQAEFLEETKRLDAFLGLGAEEHVRELLSRSVPITTLQPDECVMLFTDGVYVPHLRAQLDAANFRLDRQIAYLEPWFEAFFADADRRIPDDEFNYWPELATILVERTLELIRRRRHYRDDMAIVGIYRTDEAIARARPELTRT